MQKLTVIIIVIFSLKIFSQESTNISSIQGKELNASVRLNFIPVKMPYKTYTFSNITETMHVMGLHYHVPFTKNFYGGAGIYGALLGDQSGFFTLGATLGYQQQLYKSLYLDANFHIGGGGSNSNLVNSGLLINPNIGLQLKKQNYAFGIQYSKVDFPTGVIHSDSWSVFVEIPSTLRIADYASANKTFDISQITDNSFWQKPAVKSAVQVRFDFLFPIGNSKKDNLQNLDNTLYVLGFEYQKYLNDKTFIFAHTDAIYKGLTAGFMDLFFGVGYNWVNTNYLNLYSKLGIGAAGGRIAQEGGLTVFPSAGFDFKFTNNIALNAHVGYFKFLDGTFEAYSAGFGLKYFNFSGGVQKSHQKKFTQTKTQGLHVAVEYQTFKGLERRDEPETDTGQLAFMVFYDLNKSFYFFGEASFAVKGDAGGYANAGIGMGYATSKFLNQKFSAFAEISSGVAGGGRIDTEGGIVIKPTLGINYHLNNNFSLRFSYANFIGPLGSTKASNYNIGLVYNFSFLNVK